MTLNDLLKAGVLRPGDELIWKRRVAKTSHIAVVEKDGTLTTADGISHKSPSGAAKHLNKNKPIDGWLAWKKREGEISLAELRSNLS